MTTFARKLSRLAGQTAAVGLLTALVTTAALASGPTFIQQSSRHDFSQTVSALRHAIADNGMMVMGQINQQRVLGMTGLHLTGARSFLVGNPAVGKKLFAMDPAVGAVLPLRVFVWYRSGSTYIGYFKPSELLADINPKLEGPGRMIDHKFRAILQGATR